AKRIRKRLKQDGISSGVTCIYSEEHRVTTNSEETNNGSSQVLGSLSYMPGAMGLTAASYIIRNILNQAVE
ncbi:MAG: tRNA threonylcarbamoyladenosine dehydratase, partial [Spirochaetota bacterium]